MFAAAIREVHPAHAQDAPLCLSRIAPTMAFGPCVRRPILDRIKNGNEPGAADKNRYNSALSQTGPKGVKSRAYGT